MAIKQWFAEKDGNGIHMILEIKIGNVLHPSPQRNREARLHATAENWIRLRCAADLQNTNWKRSCWCRSSRLVAPLQLGCSAAVVVVVVDFNQNDKKIKRTLSLRDFTADYTHMPTPLGLTMDTLANKLVTLIN